MTGTQNASSSEGTETPSTGDQRQARTVSDASLAALVRALADAVIVADPAGTIVFWNAAATRIFGWSADEATGQTLDLIIPERQRDRHWAGYRKTMATGQTSYGDRLLEVPAQIGWATVRAALQGDTDLPLPVALDLLNTIVDRGISIRPDTPQRDPRRPAQRFFGSGSPLPAPLVGEVPRAGPTGAAPSGCGPC